MNTPGSTEHQLLPSVVVRKNRGQDWIEMDSLVSAMTDES